KSMLADLDVHDVDAAYRLLGGDFELGDDETPTLKSDPTADVKKHLEKQLNERYKYLLKGTQAAGGGAGGSKGSGSGTGSITPTKMTTEQIHEYIDKHGREAYMTALAAEETALLTKKAAA
ncbi:MAG TPA: hypothetical protein VFM71_00460, partial [Gemmatimonadaceae bacterium]|nr:hypothetical protein [Gemmatimonadaceae bacterium]